VFLGGGEGGDEFVGVAMEAAGGSNIRLNVERRNV
jgi:hypothetical protein